MARTATVNARRKKRKKRRRNPATSYGAAKRTSSRRRRTSPAVRKSYSSGGYRKRVSNPGLFDFDSYMKIIPPATLGNVAGRFAVKLGGPMENGQPGFAHFIAGILGINLGSNMVGKVFRDSRAEDYAYASGVGYLGELFLRKRFLADSPWYTGNISLEGDGASVQSYDQYMDGVGDHYDQGDVIQLPDGKVVQVLAGMGQSDFTTAQGQRWVQTPQGWQMSGPQQYDRRMEQPAQGLPGGTFAGFQSDSNLETGVGVDPDPVHAHSAPLDGFQNQSPLGDAYANNNSSFGYARR
jgi:hypothetical protein